MNELIRVRLDLAYDGTRFAGWARQPDLRTVQGTLEAGLAQVLRSEQRGLPAPRLTVAGRTDSGVHARGQVAHVDVDPEGWAALPGRSDRSPGESLVTRLGGVLPGDLVVRRAAPAPEGFDARFSALRRRYTYRIADAPGLRDPLRRDHVLWTRKALDVAAMDAAVRPWSGCGTSRPTASRARGRRPSASCSASPGNARPTGPTPGWRSRTWWPTRSATTWCGRWSVRRSQ
nr:hypothetical protein GCM10025730_24760 [Promicromonospora thailandica]